MVEWVCLGTFDKDPEAARVKQGICLDIVDGKVNNIIWIKRRVDRKLHRVHRTANYLQ